MTHLQAFGLLIRGAGGMVLRILGESHWRVKLTIDHNINKVVPTHPISLFNRVKLNIKSGKVREERPARHALTRSSCLLIFFWTLQRHQANEVDEPMSLWEWAWAANVYHSDSTAVKSHFMLFRKECLDCFFVLVHLPKIRNLNLNGSLFFLCLRAPVNTILKHSCFKLKHG